MAYSPSISHAKHLTCVAGFSQTEARSLYFANVEPGLTEGALPKALRQRNTACKLERV